MLSQHRSNIITSKEKKHINTPAEYYFVGMGLRNARLSFRQQEYTHIMENIIYNELRSRAYSVDVGVVENASRLCCFLSTTPSAKL